MSPRSPHGATEDEVRDWATRCMAGNARWPDDPWPAAHIEWVVAREAATVAWRRVAELTERAAGIVGIGSTYGLPSTAEVTRLTEEAQRATRHASMLRVACRLAEDRQPPRKDHR